MTGSFVFLEVNCNNVELLSCFVHICCRVILTLLRNMNISRIFMTYNCCILCFYQLTHFLDITEVALAHQISLRSEDFFHAVSSQDQLQDDVGQTNSEIKQLRYVITRSALAHLLSWPKCAVFKGKMF